MKIEINKNIVNITPDHVKDLICTVSLFQGRRFSINFPNGKRNISLNTLISAIKNEALKSDQDNKEINEFIEAFNVFKDRGYEPGGQIQQENFLVRLITRIKHFFAERKRKNLLQELRQIHLIKKSEASDETKNSTDSQLRISLIQQALETWEDCLRHKNLKPYEFPEDTALLMKSHPIEVQEALDRAIENEKEKLLPILYILEECIAVDPVRVCPLLEKVYEKRSQTNEPAAEVLHLLAMAFAEVDPQRALAIAEEMEAIGSRYHTQSMIVDKFILSNPEKAFQILDQIQPFHDKISGFTRILKACKSIDPARAYSIIQQVQNRAENYFFQTSILISDEKKNDWYQTFLKELAEAYGLSNQLEKSLEITEKIQRDYCKAFAYLSVVEHYIKLDPYQVIPILEKILSLANESNDDWLRDFILNKVAKAYLELDLTKAKNIVEQILDLDRKVDLLVSLAEKYKKFDSQVSIHFLEQAISLTQQTILKSYSSDALEKVISNFSMIIQCYLSINLNRGRELLETFEVDVRKIRVGFYEDTPVKDTYCLEIKDLIPYFAKAWFFINPTDAVNRINEFLEGPVKLHVLLTLSSID